MAQENMIDFVYEDETQSLADLLLDLLKDNKNSKGPVVYNLMKLGICKHIDDYSKTVDKTTWVEVSVTEGFHEKYQDKVIGFEDFWTTEKTIAKKAPHWNRKSVSVRVYNTTMLNDKQHNLLKLGTWFSQKNKSYVDLCMGTMFFEPDKLCNNVYAEWNQHLCKQTGDDEWIVEDSNYRGLLVQLLTLRKQVKEQKDKEMNDLHSELKNMKIKV